MLDTVGTTHADFVRLRRSASLDRVGGASIRLLEEVGVHVERRCRVAVAEPAGDGAHVDTSAEQLAGHEVPEIMEPHVR